MQSTYGEREILKYSFESNEKTKKNSLEKIHDESYIWITQTEWMDLIRVF